MNIQFARLLDAFQRSMSEPPSDLATSLHEQPRVGTLPSPWETWTLIGLLRHRDRQHWVAEIINYRLKGDRLALAGLGAMGHPEGVPQSGNVPGLPEWEYYFHGRGCCLTHKVSGEDLDVDFWDDSAEYFDTFFYTKYLESLREPEPVEQRLIELHRSIRSVSIAVTDLLSAAALVPLPERDSHPYRISPDTLTHVDAINAFCSGWAMPEKRLWLAALIGDWPAAHKAAAGRTDLEMLTAVRAESCCEIREKRLAREVRGNGRHAADALHGLADLDGNLLSENLEEAFRHPPSGLVSAALEIVGQRGNPRWCPTVYELFRRMNPTGQLPEPHIWITCLKLLLRHGYRKAEILGALPKAGGTSVGEAVLLALENAPEHALSLVRKGLLADIPMNRTEVAAILALIGKPWSKRELLRALKESDDQEKTADTRAALLEAGTEDDHKAVLDWEQRNPHENEMGDYLEIGGRRVGPFYSMGEIMLKNRASWIRYEMDKLYDRVQQVKEVVPPEPNVPRPWWRLWG